MIQIGINIAVKGTGVSGPPPAPVNTVAPLISGTTTLGSVLLLNTNGTWTNSPTSFAYQWKRGATNIGTSANNYTLVAADSSAAITCVVTATNAGGSTPATSNIITADNYTPVNTVAPVQTAITALVVGDVTNTDNGTWTNSPSSFSYQWKRGATNIGTNSNTYAVVQADAGFNITCVVTATNAVGSGNATSNSLYTYDFNAYSFVNTAIITNSTEQTAINNLVIGLKSDSLWTKMLAIYPFVGGTATSCKYNLKNTATFELLFVGTWLPASFTSFGIQPNGTDTYANTNFTPSTSWLTLGNSSISAYSRTNNSNAGTLWGTRSALNGNTSLYPILRNAAITNVLHNSNSTQAPSPLPTTSAINLMTSRIDTANLIIALNGVASSYVKAEVILSAFPIFLSAKNSSNAVEALSYSNRQLAFAHIGTGLTTVQCTLLYTRIQAFQTTLGRANP